MSKGIGTAIRITDGMSPALRSMNKALMIVLNSFESMQSATADPINTAAISEARTELARVSTTLDQVENNASGASNAMSGMPNHINEATQKAQGLNSVFQKIKETAAGVVIGNIVTGAISKASGFLKESASQAVEYASDLTEVQNVVDVAFGNMSKTVDNWAQGTLEAVGLNELSAKKYAGTMGAMLKSSGITGDAVAGMSMGITELAGDMASFYNLSGDEAFNKIRAGLSGETEPLKQLGINMSVANLEAYALSQGIETSYDKMSQAQQTLLRYNYLLSVTGDAQGDFARTQDSYANQTKLLSETWKDFTGQIATQALPQMTKVITKLNGFITRMSQYIPVIVGFGNTIVHSLQLVANWFTNVYHAVVNNWSSIAPIIYAVAGALLFYAAVMGIANTVEAASTVIKAAHAAVMGVVSTATTVATAAQTGFNAALYACPITWIIALILAIIIAIIALIGWISKTLGVTNSVLGGIIGALSAAFAIIWNQFKALADLILTAVDAIALPWIAFANFFGNLFNDPVAAIIHLFGDMADAILSILEGIANAIDAVFGSNLSSAVSGWRSGLDEKVNAFAKEKGNGSYEQVMEKVNLSTDKFGWERKNVNDSFAAGAEFGDGLADKVKNFSLTAMLDDLASSDASNVVGGNAADELGLPNFDQLAGNVGDINDNTKGIKDSVDISDEDLKYMRDIAEQEAINRFTTAEISVDFGGVSNNISSDVDLDGFMETFTDRLVESASVAAEGLHS